MKNIPGMNNDKLRSASVQNSSNVAISIAGYVCAKHTCATVSMRNIFSIHVTYRLWNRNVCGTNAIFVSIARKRVPDPAGLNEINKLFDLT